MLESSNINKKMKWLESQQPALKKNRIENRQPVWEGYN